MVGRLKNVDNVNVNDKNEWYIRNNNYFNDRYEIDLDYVKKQENKKTGKKIIPTILQN